MPRFIEREIEFFEELVKDDPKMASVLQGLKDTANLNDSLGGPKEIPEKLSDREIIGQVDKATQIKIIKFFINNPLDIPDRRLGIMKRFNSRIGKVLPDDLELRELAIPSTNRSVSDPEIVELAGRVDAKTKGFLNTLLLGISRHYQWINRGESISLGEFRDLGQFEKIGTLSQESLGIARVAFARPKKTT